MEPVEAAKQSVRKQNRAPTDFNLVVSITRFATYKSQILVYEP